MKKILIILSLLWLGFNAFAQSDSQKALQLDSMKVHFLNRISEHTASGYKLYPTENMWNFLELETFTGRIWQVQYSVNNDSARGRIILNEKNLAYLADDSHEEEFAGRFELYPTQNMYTFLLLDSFTGTVYQVQWSTESKKRGLVDVIYWRRKPTDTPYKTKK